MIISDRFDYGSQGGALFGGLGQILKFPAKRRVYLYLKMAPNELILMDGGGKIAFLVEKGANSKKVINMTPRDLTALQKMGSSPKSFKVVNSTTPEYSWNLSMMSEGQETIVITPNIPTKEGSWTIRPQDWPQDAYGSEGKVKAGDMHITFNAKPLVKTQIKEVPRRVEVPKIVEKEVPVDVHSTPKVDVVVKEKTNVPLIVGASIAVGLGLYLIFK